MTRDELLSYDAEEINRMNKEELLALAKAEQKNLKDAMRRLRKSGIKTPASKQYEKTGNISAKKSMSLNQLRHEVMKGQVMLRYKTGTVSGAKEFLEDVRGNLLTQLSGRLDEPITETQSENLWTIIAKLVEDAPGLIDAPDLKYVPAETQQRVYDIIKITEKLNNTDYMNRELSEEDEDAFYEQVRDYLQEEYDQKNGVTNNEDSDFYSPFGR